MPADARENFGACPLVSWRLITAPPIWRRLSNISRRTGSSGWRSGGRRETFGNSSAVTGPASNTPSNTHPIIDLRIPDPSLAMIAGSSDYNRPDVGRGLSVHHNVRTRG